MSDPKCHGFVSINAGRLLGYNVCKGKTFPLHVVVVRPSEFLLSLNHPYENTSATENYPPNVDLCRETLLPLGIDFRAADGKDVLPFEDASFDMVINRHGDSNPGEIYRVLKPGGLFITQQVGAENDRELIELLCGQTELPFPDQYVCISAEDDHKLLKAMRKARTTPILILSSQSCHVERLKVLQAGAHAYIGHPYSL